MLRKLFRGFLLFSFFNVKELPMQSCMLFAADSFRRFSVPLSLSLRACSGASVCVCVCDRQKRSIDTFFILSITDNRTPDTRYDRVWTRSKKNKINNNKLKIHLSTTQTSSAVVHRSLDSITVFSFLFGYFFLSLVRLFDSSFNDIPNKIKL